jgi:hypothetical protein
MTDVIEFLCPNGHKIHCPAEQAGRAAKCPRCGVRFRIPDPAELDVSDSVGEDSGFSQPELTDSSVEEIPPAAQRGAVRQESQIEFLCPNGHQLHGPASLQGRPGECPDCGARFHIPTYWQPSEPEQVGQGPVAGPADRPGDSGVTLEPVVETIEPAGREPFGEGPKAGRLAAAGHPLARLFAKLWAEKPGGATVELHLGDGKTLVPDHFAKTLSGRSHGVFAVNEPDGTHTLTVVAWNGIAQVVVRGVDKLPPEISD